MQNAMSMETQAADMTKQFHGTTQTSAKFPKKRKILLAKTAASLPLTSPRTFSPRCVEKPYPPRPDREAKYLTPSWSATMPGLSDLGDSTFLELGLSRSSLYPAILSRVKAAATLLDLGCALVHDMLNWSSTALRPQSSTPPICPSACWKLATRGRPSSRAGSQLGRVWARSYPLGVDVSGVMFRHDLQASCGRWVVGEETASTWQVGAVTDGVVEAGCH